MSTYRHPGRPNLTVLVCAVAATITAALPLAVIAVLAYIGTH